MRSMSTNGGGEQAPGLPARSMSTNGGREQAPGLPGRCRVFLHQPGGYRISRLLKSVFILFVLMTAGTHLRGQTFPYREYTPDDGLPQTQSNYIMQDSRGYLWIPTRNGLARFDGYSFVSYLRRDGLPSNMVLKVIEDHDSTIWATTMNGMARFDGKSFTPYPLTDSLGVKQIAETCQGFDLHSFFINAQVNHDTVALLLFENGQYRNLSREFPELTRENLKPLVSDPDDSLLYLTDPDKNIWTFDMKSLRFAQKGPVESVTLVDGLPVYGYTPPDMNNDALPLYWEGPPLSFGFTDRAGTVWFGTETSVYRILSKAFIEYDSRSGLPEGTWAIVPDKKGGFWVGTVEGQLSYFDGTRFTPRDEFKKLFGKTTPFYRGSTLLSNGEVWFSTRDGVLVWDGHRFSRPAIAPYEFQVCIIWEDPVDKSIFIGSDRGLFHLKGKEVINYERMSWPDLGVVEGVARDHNGNYWLAGHYGIVFFDGKKFTPYRSAPAPAEMVWGVICDYRGNIWSAGSDGLFQWSPDELAFEAALPDGLNLPANVIRDLGDRRLLVGRMMDICIIDLDKYYSGDTDYYHIIDRSRGFLGNDCQDNGIIRDRQGQWWILTNEKLIRFNPDLVEKNKLPPLNHLTRVDVPGESAGWKTILEAELFYKKENSIKIKGRENSIRISYTGISTRNPENVRYQYRLKGLDDKWSLVTDERSVIYPDLRPGDYLFEVHAINADGVMSTTPATLSVTVGRTFFQSFFATALMIVLALALVIFLTLQIRKSVLSRRVEAARNQAETYRLQLNSVIRQFDPHFTFNAVTSVGSLIMKGEKEKAYHYFIKLSNLLRSIISDSGQLLKPLEQELEFVTRYCELQQLRFGNRFEYRIIIPPDVSLDTPVPKMIIQSFVENALKHGLQNKKGSGFIEIRVSSRQEGIEITIRDNGIGRAAAALLGTDGTGTGLRNINGIVATLNKANPQKITVELTDLYEDEQPAGTEARIFLPHNYSITFSGDLITID